MVEIAFCIMLWLRIKLRLIKPVKTTVELVSTVSMDILHVGHYFVGQVGKNSGAYLGLILIFSVFIEYSIEQLFSQWQNCSKNHKICPF